MKPDGDRAGLQSVGRIGRGRQPRAEMNAARALAVLQHLAALDIPVWVHGGWGIDALLGRQTRPHDDLDLVIRLEDAARIELALHHLGYVYTAAGPPVRGQNII